MVSGSETATPFSEPPTPLNPGPTATLTSRRPPSRRPRRFRPLFIVLCLLLFITFLWTMVPVEIGNWFEAAAMVKLQEDDLDGALKWISRAIEMSPDYMGRRKFRGEIYIRLGRFKDAIDDWNGIVSHSEKLTSQSSPSQMVQLFKADKFVDIPTALNNRAYARARGKIQIQEGLQDIQRAIKLLDSESHQMMLVGVHDSRAGIALDQSRAAFWDTRGYLYYLTGDYPAALYDLKNAVSLAQKSAVYDLRQLRKRATDRAHLMHYQLRHNQEMAVMLHHRGLVYQKLDQQDLAESDLLRANQLGYDPENGIW